MGEAGKVGIVFSSSPLSSVFPMRKKKEGGKGELFLYEVCNKKREGESCSLMVSKSPRDKTDATMAQR